MRKSLADFGRIKLMFVARYQPFLGNYSQIRHVLLRRKLELPMIRREAFLNNKHDFTIMRLHGGYSLLYIVTWLILIT